MRQPGCPPAPEYCGVCILAVRAEIEQGLLDLDDYLANWAAFAAWCEARGRPAKEQPHRKPTTHRNSNRHDEGVTMKPAEEMQGAYRELAHRVTDGLEVVLFWHGVHGRG